MKVYRLADRYAVNDSRLATTMTILLAFVFAIIGLAPLVYVLITDSDAISGSNYQKVRYMPQPGSPLSGGPYR